MGQEWWHVLGVVLLAFGVVARVTRFLTSDDLAGPIRSAVVRRFGPESAAATLTECPWCASIWISAAVTPVAYWCGGHWWFQVPALWLTLSYGYGFLAQREEPVGT